jgi:hypothetical protein
MPLPSCAIGGHILDPTAVRAKGQLVGVLSHTTVTVTYFQPHDGQATGNLYLPIDNDTCLHSVLVRFADTKIDFQVRRKEEAAAEFKAACTSGKTACVVNLSEKRVARMEIGNIPGQSNFIVEYQVTVLASSHGDSAIYFKLPLESCNPAGRMISLGQDRFRNSRAVSTLHNSRRFKKFSRTLLDSGG